MDGFTRRCLIPVLIFVIGLWVATLFILGDLSYEARGSFGNMFGAVNALFLGLAFAGVIFAIVLQTKQLQIQMQELVETKKELHEQKGLIETHAAGIRKQSFEQSFFKMLEWLTVMAKEVNYKHIRGIELLTGERAFEVFFTTIVPELWGKYDTQSQTIAVRIREVFKGINKKLGSPFIRFLSMLSTLLIFIEDEEMINKNVYYNLLLSQLTDYQIVMMSFYGTSERTGKIKYIIEKHRLLRNLKTNTLFIDDHLELYDSHAFQEGEAEKTV